MRFVREDVDDLVVAHDDVKIGFAISDEVIYVLIYFIYFFIGMVSCWKIILNYIHRWYLQLILRVSWANRSDTPFEVGGISTAIFLCTTKPTPFMAGVAADVIQIMDTVV